MARESWTDERLDDLKEGIDHRFDRVEATMKEGFARVDGEIKELRGDMKELRGDIKGMQRLMVQGLFGVCTLMVTCFLTLAGMIAL